MLDAIVEQLTDDELHRRLTPGTNSVATLLRHLGGNLKSRWTDFLTTDGEKITRDRDAEFADWQGDRAALLAYFEAGWRCLISTLSSLSACDLEQDVVIRGETQPAIQAILRSLTHVSYHVGQIALIARLVHDGEWNWVTIAPNASEQFNKATWGTSASRGVAGETRSE